MRLFVPPLQIEDTEGFTPEKDIFGRKESGARLTNLLSTVDDPLVIAVEADWGAGKTTFLKMWAGELRKAGFSVIYFDAFENDYAGDAFSAIAAQIIALSKTLKKQNTPEARRFAQMAMNAGKVLVRSGLKVGVKAATVGALDAADFVDIAKEIGTELATLEDKYLGELLTRQNEERETIQSFRQSLAELPGLFSSKQLGAEAGEDVATKPLIIILDELDRCRPAFALDLLERIKHFFSVPDVHFVLGTQMSQLENSVRVAYGADIDATLYLQKFIHLIFHLMDREQYENERTATKYVDYLTHVLEFKPEDNQVLDTTSQIIAAVAHANRLSLRSVDRVMSMLAIALAFTGKNFTLRIPSLIAGLAVLKVMRPDLYAKAKKGHLTYKEAHVALGLGAAFQKDEWVTEWWQFATGESMAKDKINEMFGYIAQAHLDDRRSLLPRVANGIMDRMTSVTPG